MAIEHKLIADADRHEVKGASLAVNKQVLKSSGDGSTYFGFVNADEIVGATAGSGYKQVLLGQSSAANQQPSSTDTALQVEFGSAQSVTDVALSSAGLLTFSTAGQYLVQVNLQVGLGSSSGTSIVLVRALKNSSQLYGTNAVAVDSAALVVPCRLLYVVDASATNTMAIQIARNSSGQNAGGLTQNTLGISGWSASPCAEIIVSKYVGN